MALIHYPVVLNPASAIMQPSIGEKVAHRWTGLYLGRWDKTCSWAYSMAHLVYIKEFLGLRTRAKRTLFICFELLLYLAVPTMSGRQMVGTACLCILLRAPCEARWRPHIALC